MPNQIIQLSQACIPLLCFSANIWIALFVCRHVWRGILVHQCLYTDKHTLKELVSPRLNLHRVGRWGEQFFHLRAREEAWGDQEHYSQTTQTTHHWQQWGREVILEVWWSPWRVCGPASKHARSRSWAEGVSWQTLAKDKLCLHSPALALTFKITEMGLSGQKNEKLITM